MIVCLVKLGMLNKYTEKTVIILGNHFLNMCFLLVAEHVLSSCGTGLRVPRYVKSSRSRDQTRESRIGRQIPLTSDHQEVPLSFYTNLKDIYPDSVQIVIEILTGIAMAKVKVSVTQACLTFEIP